MMGERKSNKASCPVCGVEAGKHSLREGGVCDGIRNGFINATTKEKNPPGWPETVPEPEPNA